MSISNTTTPAQPLPSNQQSLQRKKRWAIIAYGALIFLSSILYILSGGKTADGLSKLYFVLISICPFLWCKYDAMQHGVSLDKLTGAVIILNSPLGIAMYLTKVRRYPFGVGLSLFFFTSLVMVAIYCAGAFTLAAIYVMLFEGI